ncbi:MAG: hypothetical protein M0C28_33525 [Candidatus Moduliflexus flocculans]|nr:hypothetical protein [Candidatus Moduliflexus flocculans]
MAAPIASNFNRLTSADLLKFKRYLVENVGRSMEGEPLQLGDRAEIHEATSAARSMPRPK